MPSGSAGFIRSAELAKGVHDREQFRSDAADARTVGRDVALPPALLTRSEPDRNDHLQGKKPLRPLGPHRSPCRSVSARRMPKPASLCRRDADRVTSRYKNPFWLEGVQIITRIALVTCIDYLELLLINQNMHMLLLITTNDQIHLFELYKFINRIRCKPIFMNLYCRNLFSREGV